MTAADIRVGTSGWHYLHWRGPFYPPEMKPAGFLQYYVRYFDSVELNNSFYRLPSEAAMARWRDAVPLGFVYAVKASRFLTHQKKLADIEAPLALFLERAAILEDRLGPVLFQLPPRFGFQPARLEALLEAFPRRLQAAFEFRDPDWLRPEAFALLRRYGAALCIYDFAGTQSPLEVTADFVYVRLHGPGGAYAGSYSRETLAFWAAKLEAWAEAGIRGYCYFDNDEAGYAVHNALTLKQMLH
jgi:uncharacterized protein YecE (DUF72 family)